METLCGLWYRLQKLKPHLNIKKCQYQCQLLLVYVDIWDSRESSLPVAKHIMHQI